jgi:hypothetical protein
MNNIANCDITTGQCYPIGPGLYDYIPEMRSQIWVLDKSIYVAYCNGDFRVSIVNWDDSEKQWDLLLTTTFYLWSPTQITVFNGSLTTLSDGSNGTRCHGTDGNIIRYRM